MRWEFIVSARYLMARKRERFISLISLISMAGVAVGVAALIVVISVMSGFDEELKDKIIGINAHLVVESAFGIEDASSVRERAGKIPHVVASAPYVHGQAMLRSEENVTGILLKGIEPDSEATVNKIGSYMTRGSLRLGDDGIALGSELAKKLDLAVGDTVSVVTPVQVRGRALTVKGIFASGMYEYDVNLAYVGLGTAQELFGAKGLVSGVALRLDDAFQEQGVKDALVRAFAAPYVVRTWVDSNKNLLNALKLEKTVMFIILTLIVMVACFNITSTLIMTVLEKTKDIGILKALGAPKSSIMRVFAIYGGLIGLAGTAAGALLGILLSWSLKTFKFISLPKDIYYIDRLPVNVQWEEVAVIVLSSMVITLAATLYPSLQASRLDPVEALRYE